MICNSRAFWALSASVLAIGVATPSLAATVAGIGQTTTQIDVNSILIISNIGDNFTFGVDNTGSGPITSTVNSVPTGEVSQSGNGNGVGPGLGDAVLALNNNGAVHITADANASGAAAQTANAFVQTGVNQIGNGVSTANLALNNTGTLAISALADADAAGFNGAANATIDYGIYQAANAGTAASVALTNATSSDRKSVV